MLVKKRTARHRPYAARAVGVKVNGDARKALSQRIGKMNPRGERFTDQSHTTKQESKGVGDDSSKERG